MTAKEIKQRYDRLRTGVKAEIADEFVQAVVAEFRRISEQEEAEAEDAGGFKRGDAVVIDGLQSEVTLVRLGR